MKPGSGNGRKFSESMHDVISAFQELRSEHEGEEQGMRPGLAERELHRLRKIYAVEEASCILENIGKIEQ